MELESRSLVGPVKSDGLRFSGYAAIFGERAFIGPKNRGFYEQVARGAFAKAIAETDIRMTFNHSPDNLLARTGNGTLRLKEDDRGLAVEADLADTQLGHDVAKLVDRQDIPGMSFQFGVRSDSWESIAGGAQLRTLQDVECPELGPVVFPAYAGTAAAMRSALLTAPAEVRSAILTAVAAVEEERAALPGMTGTKKIIAGLDAAIDAAITALKAGDQKMALGHLSAADTVIDALMVKLGIPDPDEEGARATLTAEQAQAIFNHRRRWASLAGGLIT